MEIYFWRAIEAYALTYLNGVVEAVEIGETFLYVIGHLVGFDCYVVELSQRRSTA